MTLLEPATPTDAATAERPAAAGRPAPGPAARPAAPQSSPPTSPPPTSPPLRVLVADDDPVLRELAPLHLAALGAEVVGAADGLAALELFHAQPFDLALVDLDMPRLDGLGLLLRLRAAEAARGDGRRLPVVVATGRDDVFAIDRAYEAGATGFVTKPLNWPLLAHHLRYVVRSSRLEADLVGARDEAREQGRLAEERRALAVEAGGRAEQAATLRAHVLRVLRHETRTPLNAMIGFADLIEREVHGPVGAPSYREYAGHVREASQRLHEALSDLLLAGELFAGGVAMAPDDYALAPLMADAAAAAGAAPALVCPAGQAVHADRRWLVSALRGLVDNAQRHGGGHRGVPVEVEALALPDGGVVIEVRDRGEGVEPGRFAEGYEPFAGQPLQGPSHAGSQGGLGLGLALAARVALQHGGGFEAGPREGGGLVARLTLPGAGA